jgi:hypothetical protein
VGAAIGGVVALGGVMIDAANAAMEDKKQADNLVNTLKNIPGVTQAAIDKNAAWIDSMELATLVSDTDLRAAVGKLALATGDLADAQNLAKLATDVAAGSGKSYATVTDAMAKAAAGNTTQLTRMFPWLDKNNDGTVTLTEATEGLGEAYSGAAAKAAKNDPWKRMKVIWDQLYEAVGELLLPVIEKLGDWFADPKNRAAIGRMIDKVSELSREMGGKLVDAIRNLMEWLKDPANQRTLKNWAEGFADIQLDPPKNWAAALIDAPAPGVGDTVCGPHHHRHRRRTVPDQPADGHRHRRADLPGGRPAADAGRRP